VRLRIDPRALEAHPAAVDRAGEEIVIGIRPENFEVKSAVQNATDDQVLDIDVLFVEQLGSEAFVHFEEPIPPVVTPDIHELLADQGQDASVLGETTKMTARVNPDMAPKVGDRVPLWVDTSKMHFFDKDSGEKL